MSASTLTFGSVCTGIGGLDLGFEWEGFKCKWMCEIEPYARSILRKHWPGITIYEDIRELRGDATPYVDILIGGFPCQDVSYANPNTKGLDGDRSGPIFYEIIRLVGEIRPRYVVLENVSALIARGMERVLTAFHICGYDVRWDTVSAASVGALHRRDRIFIVAVRRDDADTESRREQELTKRDYREEERREAQVGHGIGTGCGGHERNPSEGTEYIGGISAEVHRDIPDADGMLRRHRSGRIGQQQAQSEEEGTGRCGAGDVSHSVCERGKRRKTRVTGIDPQYEERILRRSDTGDIQDTFGIDGPKGTESNSKGDHLGTADETVGTSDADRHGIAGPCKRDDLAGIFSGKPSGSDYWLSEPDVGRVVDGVPSRLDRLRCLGNAVVPQVAEHVARCVLEYDRRRRDRA